MLFLAMLALALKASTADARLREKQLVTGRGQYERRVHSGF
jgi:hypothetical protein